MDLFDILGPVMVGPSSSHTAGAARIGMITRLLLGAEPVQVIGRKVVLYKQAKNKDNRKIVLPVK